VPWHYLAADPALAALPRFYHRQLIEIGLYISLWLPSARQVHGQGATDVRQHEAGQSWLWSSLPTLPRAIT